MSSETVSIGVANEGEISLLVEVVEKWEVSNESLFRDTMFFKSGGSYYSMKNVDYIKIFKDKKDGDT